MGLQNLTDKFSIFYLFFKSPLSHRNVNIFLNLTGFAAFFYIQVLTSLVLVSSVKFGFFSTYPVTQKVEEVCCEIIANFRGFYLQLRIGLAKSH